jgi:hypothetical protein
MKLDLRQSWVDVHEEEWKVLREQAHALDPGLTIDEIDRFGQVIPEDGFFDDRLQPDAIFVAKGTRLFTERWRKAETSMGATEMAEAVE